MNLKLGEALIQAGMLTKAQLEETLKEQAIFGGKFGTNLIEMGYIEEDELAVFLSRKTGIPSATPDQLMEVRPEVVALLPEEVVKKYRVMPVALNNKRLTLAMADPSDFAAIDDISFITGFIVTPLITPELRLVCALEKHYKIMRETRYIRINATGRRRKPGNAPAAARFVDSPFTSEGFGESQPHFGEPPSFAEPVSAYESIEVAEQSEEEKVYLMETAVRELAEARNRQAIAELVVNYAAQFCDSVAFFLLKGDKALGWLAQSRGGWLPGFQSLEVPLPGAPFFVRVAQQQSSLLGILPDTPGRAVIAAALGSPPGAQSLLVPLLMGGRVVAVLYLESRHRKMGERAGDLRKLLEKAAMAFEILILKSKILMT